MPDTRCTSIAICSSESSKPAFATIGERIRVQGAGIDEFHSPQKALQPLLGIALVGAELAAVLSRKGVSKAVFEKAARADNDRRLPEVIQQPFEMLDHLLRKPAFQKTLLDFLELLHRRLGTPRDLQAKAEEIVVHQEREKHVRTDEERVEVFKRLGTVASRLLEDLPGQQHAGRFPADPPGSNDPVTDIEQVVRVEVRIGKLEKVRVRAEKHAHQLFLQRLDLRRLLRQVLSRFLVTPQPRVHAVPGRDRTARGRQRSGVSRQRDFGRVIARQHRHPALIGHPMGPEHLRRVTIPDFERLDVHLALDPVEINQDLGRVPDARNRPVRVAGPSQGKVSDRVQLEQVGAGDLEKIGEKLVGAPIRHQRREIVKDVKDFPAFPLDDLVKIRTEDIEAGAGIELAQLGSPNPPE